jgi:polyphosphate glucokinase
MKRPSASRTILSIDVGGSHIKLMTNTKRIKREFVSGPDLTARSMVEKVKQITKDWTYDLVSDDALMQALGGYKGGKMLFLGLGTGLGSAMIVDGALVPMELAHLPYRKEKSFEDFVGAAGLKRHGKKRWTRYVDDVVERLVAALEPDYVILGGGNAGKLGTLPDKTRLGRNENAFLGGFRLWELAPPGKRLKTSRK